MFKILLNQVILVTYFISLLSVSSTSFALVKMKRGQIRFDNRIKNFGRVVRGEKLTYGFSFRNNGKGILKIQGVHSSCGCTVAKIDPTKEYKPGEKGLVVVEFDTSNFSGKIKKIVSVMTNEKIRPDRNLILKAEILQEFKVEPPLVDLGNIYMNENKLARVVVTPINNFPLEITNIKYNKSVFNLNFKKDQKKWIIEISLKKDQPSGYLKEKLYLESNSSYLKDIPLPFLANIKGNIEYKPAYLEFGVVKNNLSVLRKISFKSQKEFKIKSVESILHINGELINNTRDILEIKFPQKSLIKNGEVSITIKNKLGKEGSVHGKIIFKTNDPLQEKIKIDYYAFFK